MVQEKATDGLVATEGASMSERASGGAQTTGTHTERERERERERGHTVTAIVHFKPVP